MRRAYPNFLRSVSTEFWKPPWSFCSFFSYLRGKYKDPEESWVKGHDNEVGQDVVEVLNEASSIELVVPNDLPIPVEYFGRSRNETFVRRMTRPGH